MKKTTTVAIAATLIASMSMSSCIGSFGLTNKLLAWNRHISSKFVNELVFFAFWIVPVYEVSALADLLVLNTIEFWSGSSPVAKGKTMIDGKDGKYLVDCDGKGYTITSLNDGSKTRLNFHQDENTWTVVAGDKELPLIVFVDDAHVKMPAPDGSMTTVELSYEGLFAYQQMATAAGALAMK